MNDYSYDLYKTRMVDMHEAAARRALLRSLRRPLRVSLGTTLISVGRWLLGQAREGAPGPLNVEILEISHRCLVRARLLAGGERISLNEARRRNRGRSL